MVAGLGWYCLHLHNQEKETGHSRGQAINLKVHPDSYSLPQLGAPLRYLTVCENNTGARDQVAYHLSLGGISHSKCHTFRVITK